MGVGVGQLAAGRDVEAVHLRAMVGIAVADHHDGIAGDQHLVIPGPAARCARREGIDAVDRQQGLAMQVDGEQPAPAQHDQMVTVDLDDAAFVDASRLDIGDAGIGGRCGLRRSFRCSRRGGRRRRRIGSGGLEPAVCRLGAPQERGQLVVGTQAAHALFAKYRRGHGHGDCPGQHCALQHAPHFRSEFNHPPALHRFAKPILARADE